MTTIYSISGDELYTSTKDTMKEAVEEAVAGGANLIGANLEEADLIGANLEVADLKGANLTGVYLEGANLEVAKIWMKEVKE